MKFKFLVTLTSTYIFKWSLYFRKKNPNIQIYKCVLNLEKKFLLCLFKINISTCFSASTNWIIAKKNEKSRDTVQQI